jgi:hypothetical protein
MTGRRLLKRAKRAARTAILPLGGKFLDKLSRCELVSDFDDHSANAENVAAHVCEHLPAAR